MRASIQLIDCMAGGIRWAGRLLGLALVGLVIVFLVGTGGFNPGALGFPEALERICLLTICVGFLLGCLRELAGGILAVSGVVLFQLIELIVNGRVFSSSVFGLMLLAGLLLVISRLLRMR